ncbi:undecaprenyldiphospho-muramoylpentapeptide beta-N-acetylglucosaminyltransferase [Amorphus orientalis]|uniref:UDP-N-acetylglucosamine--N-acetylmuramyl-(pentapeptide) pyrophosphoryl-undecaprenol N-acetylglucosamine transferase n=1 Tax=Amorphus orientalis TaxID=649198 RepID=A0AAE4ATU7_9HYPH|nr:undecaprenyldiphospho-muramoylpentapeptide beta-N-acetylglucosaminyltransferase [Amorphus orientalis]MDQ0315314.1 UDP-N-acetylglucosamine--N-acetylmuramyl-(pentapeptide) pyrophosphoryl-undecaprenol N-acetylglucosamine transferase [Amorphus orientalis]
MTRGTILLAAGGTGGHLFPAEAVAHELGKRGFAVELVTDPRAEPFRATFPARAMHVVSSGSLSMRMSPAALVSSAVKLGSGFVRAARLIRRIKPDAVVGFGGYPTLPPVLAARMLGRPAVVHEANAVLGRANKLLSRYARVAVAFPNARGLSPKAEPPVHTGMPVRPSVFAAATDYHAPDPDGPVRLVVFGGSQGARVFSDIVPPAVEQLPADLRKRLSIVQQCRPEDLDEVRGRYQAAGVEAEIAPFFKDLPERISAAHLVVSRSGASTVAELATIGRPAFLVPLPHALDQDQRANATAFQEAGGGWMVDQADLTPESLARELEAVCSDPARLASAAGAARSLAQPDASARLADFVEEIAGLSRDPSQDQGHH